jgi:hypothetical protein
MSVRNTADTSRVVWTGVKQYKNTDWIESTTTWCKRQDFSLNKCGSKLSGTIDI